MGAEEIIQWVAIGMSLMGSSIIIVLKILGNKKNSRKKADASESDNPGNLDHGERIKGCETEIENLKVSNEKDHRLIRADIKKLFELLNRKGRK